MKHSRIVLNVLAVLGLMLFPAICMAEKTERLSELPPLISRDILFGNPQKKSPQISPDGTQLAYLAPSGKGVMNVWVRTLDNGKEIMVTRDAHRGIRTYFWAYSGVDILYLQDNAGDENFHLYSASLKTSAVRDLTPFQGVRAVNIIPGKKEILVGMNLRNPQLFDMYRIDLDTGAVKLDTENPGDVIYLTGEEWLADGNLVIRAARALNLENGEKILRVRDGPDQPWRVLLTWGWDSDIFDGFAIGFTDNGRSLYVLSSTGFDTPQILKIDAVSGRVLETSASNKRCNPLPGDTLVQPQTGQLQAVIFEYLLPEWKILDSSLGIDFSRLQKIAGGHFRIDSRDRSDSRWLVSFMRDDGPVSTYLYDRKTGRAQFLFDDRPELARYKLARMKPVLITARDGLKLPSYLTLPAGSSMKKLPLVLYVHGGPTARDSWTYEPLVQLLANRGCAVLQVNFRGSVGFGKTFQKAGDGQAGVGSMQHDLTDAVRWAIHQGIADPQRVAIIGYSYGGYATLAGLAFTPELYACGIDGVGPSNLKTMLESIPPYYGPLKKIFLKIFGDAENDEAYNHRVSPLFHVDRIRAPLLVAQGANDPRCNIRESDQIVQALRDKKLPVTYVVYTDEGHGFKRPENELDFYGRIEEFLGKHLNIRFEPYREIPGSSGELR